MRRAISIHWEWTTEYSREEIATALGVRKSTVDRYLRDGPTDEVKELMNDVESEVRMVAVAELKDQLKRAGSRSRTSEKPVKVWTDADGDLHVRDVFDEDGELVKKVPVPSDIEIGANEEARFYARQEVREIIDQLTDLTGAGEPTQLEHTGPGGGPLEVVINEETVETGHED